jgi:DNA-binding beta-propeller fold protein YncE
LCISPDGSTLYVGVYGGVNVYNTATYGFAWNVGYRSGFGPNNVAVTLDGKKAYVSDYTHNDIAVLDTVGQAVINYLSMGGPTFDVKTHPDTGLIYVPATTVQVIDSTLGPPQGTIVQSIPTSSAPQWMAFP